MLKFFGIWQAYKYTTFPADLARTERRPDGLLINREQKWVKIFELTVPAIYNMEKRHIEKTDKYMDEIATQIRAKGYDVEVLAFEVSTLGFVGSSFTDFLKKMKISKQKIKMCSREVSFKAVTCSRSIIGGKHYTIIC